MTRIEGRESTAWASGTWEAAACQGDNETALLVGDADGNALVLLPRASALRLGAFLLARGLGVADVRATAGTLILVAPDGAAAVDLEDAARAAGEVHHGPVVVLPPGWS